MGHCCAHATPPGQRRLRCAPQHVLRPRDARHVCCTCPAHISVASKPVLDVCDAPLPLHRYLKNCLFDMLVAGGSDPSALLAVALSFSSQCEAVASTQQDDGFTPGDVADATGSLGFENTVFSAGSSATYAYATDIDATPGWWSGGLAGVSKGSSVFQHNLAAPEGTHVAFVQVRVGCGRTCCSRTHRASTCRVVNRCHRAWATTRGR